MRGFNSWLTDNGVRGFIGEVGWPNRPEEDTERWQALAEDWFTLADEAGLAVTAWATGEWWPGDYPLAVYGSRRATGVDSPNPQASVLEDHLHSVEALRGINVAGGEFGSPVDEPTSEFSNLNPGTYGRDYHYDSAQTFGYLSEHGIGVVRLPFRWERLQPELGGELETAELDRLKRVVADSARAGVSVILDMHNYGAYYLDDEGRGVRCPIGSRECPTERFVDVWLRISEVFRHDDSVVAYGLMNEPIGLEGSGDSNEAEVWHDASQAALSAIRKSGDSKLIMVSGYFWASLREWMRRNPETWIEDPADNFMYEAHHYFDGDASGRYLHSYADEVAASR